MPSESSLRHALVRGALAAHLEHLQRGGALTALCNAALPTIPALAAGVTIMGPVGAATVGASSGDLAYELEELQVMYGEGPGVEAYETRRPVFEPDLDGGAAGRWPMYVQSASERGVVAVFAFPLQVGAAHLGVLDVYRAQSGLLSSESLALALTFAEVAVELLLDGQGDAQTGVDAGDLDGAIDHDAAVFQAQGMLMVDLGVSIRDAAARLRAFAFAQDRRIGDVARDVVGGVLRLEKDGP